MTYSYFIMVADTVYPDTNTDAFMIDEAAESIVSKYIGRDNSFYSDYLDTCAGNFSIMRGLHVRGYMMADKPFAMSFDDWWEGANPILNLGLGYEEIGGIEFIRVEEKAYFYDTTKSLNLDYVSGIVKTYDRKKIIKSISVGYKKWSAESASGIDDPQAKLTFATLFEQIGEELRIESEFIAASLAIEQTRRNRVELGKDWRLDEEVIIINVTDDSTPILPETDNDFDSVTNLLNSDTRYNTMLSAKRNLLRWGNVLVGCLQSNLSSTLKFVRGEGNYDLTSDYGSACSALGVLTSAVREGDDLSVTTLNTATVRPEVETQDHISFFDRTNCLTVLINRYNRLDKLIRYLLVVRFLNRFKRITRRLAESLNQGIVCELDPFPTFVTVHSVVSTYNRCQSAGGLRDMRL
jgi:hypothetical protein